MLWPLAPLWEEGGRGARPGGGGGKGGGKGAHAGQREDNRVEWEELLRNTEVVFEGESRLILLPARGKAVFVGDTHGDLDATQRVVRRFLRKPYLLVFLGDYVDRGEFSRENLHYLLQLKQEHPEEIFLLAGNHEGYMVKEFYPANFWESLSPEEQEALGHLFSRFPLAATSQNGILALHGGLPDLNSLED